MVEEESKPPGTIENLEATAGGAEALIINDILAIETTDDESEANVDMNGQPRDNENRQAGNGEMAGFRRNKEHGERLVHGAYFREDGIDECSVPTMRGAGSSDANSFELPEIVEDSPSICLGESTASMINEFIMAEDVERDRKQKTKRSWSRVIRILTCGFWPPVI